MQPVEAGQWACVLLRCGGTNNKKPQIELWFVLLVGVLQFKALNLESEDGRCEEECLEPEGLSSCVSVWP